MVGRTAALAATIPALALLPARPVVASEVDDLFFGEALFYAYQEHWFDALQRLDVEIAQHHAVDEPELDSLYPYIGRAEFSVGDLELHYRMHHRAGRAIKAVLEADVEDPVRNEAAYRLARIHFQKGQHTDGLRALDGIRGTVPQAIQADVEFLRANLYMALGRPADAAEVLRDLQGAKELAGFATYNLGIALLRDGRERDAVRQLDRAGRVRSRDGATLAIRDKSNLVLGTLYFDAGAFGPAQESLDRVRLSGPFSNQALLRAGWADASAGNFRRAVVPWDILAEREATDTAVQEAMLALPYAYSKLGVHGRAAVLYGRAVDAFGGELEKVDASIRSIRQSEFLKALVREEIRRDQDWVIRLRSLEGAPETFYLIALMASHDFQTALQNYLDLEDLRKRLVARRADFDAFTDVIRLRRDYYEPRLPAIDRTFRGLDAQMRLRLEQRRHLEKRLERMLVAPRPDLLATSEEQHLAARIGELEQALGDRDDASAAQLRERVRRLRGALTWTVETRYHDRLTELYGHLRELDDDVEALQARYDAFVRARQAATHSYVGYETPIRRLRMRVQEALERLDRLMARQGRALEAVAIRELDARRTRLVAQQNQARFAFADSYDRAAKAKLE